MKHPLVFNRDFEVEKNLNRFVVNSVNDRLLYEVEHLVHIFNETVVFLMSKFLRIKTFLEKLFIFDF